MKIGETRRAPDLMPSSVGPARGVLKANEPDPSIVHRRLPAPGALEPFVQHCWYLQWDRRDAGPLTAETLPHPNCYLIFEHDLARSADDPSVHSRAEVSGVTTGTFRRALGGHGRVFGLKFHPGGLRPFLRGPASALTNRVVPATEIFGADILALATELRALDDPEAMAACAAAYLAERLPEPDEKVALAKAVVEAMLGDPSILTVDGAAERSGLSKRALQRLLNDYVGVPPKWIIRRFRLHELVERFNAGQSFDGAQLALDLGYADQSHLINDFRKLAGMTPTDYNRRVARANGMDL